MKIIKIIQKRQFYLKLLTELSDSINSDDYIEKSHQNLSDNIQFLFKKRFECNKKGIISI